MNSFGISCGPTTIRWASGAIIKVAGITGRICGMKYKRADGQTVRPSLAVLDSSGSRLERVGFAWGPGKVVGR